jgi:glutathione S-transferase
MAKIKLYQFGPLAGQESASPFCVKVQYALRYKRLPFDAVNLTSPAAARKLNVRAKLPVVDYDGALLPDSSDIIRYLEENSPEPPLYPRDARARALALTLEDWADESLYWHVVYERWMVGEQFDHVAAGLFESLPAFVRPLVKLMAARKARRDLRGQGLGRFNLAEQREKLGFVLGWLDTMVDSPFLCGAELCVADIAVAAQIAALDNPLTPIASQLVRRHTNLVRWLHVTRTSVYRDSARSDQTEQSGPAPPPASLPAS